jgi:putative copper resistance protein D
MSGMQALPFTLRNVFTHWSFSPFSISVAIAVVLLAIWYLRAEWALAARGRRWSRGRTAAFLTGLVVIDVALQSSLATYVNWYFEAHVIQHLLLMVVAPTLLALGAPSTLFLQTAGRRAKERWLHVLRSWPFALLSNPITVWFLYFGVMFVFFLTSLINLAMQHPALMDALNVLFLFGGCMFWWPMVGIDPVIHWKLSHGSRMLILLLGSGLEAFLGVAILNASHPEASMYTLSSSRSGGALLWVSVEIVNIAVFIPIFIQWVRSEERLAARLDARADREAEKAKVPVGEDGPLEPARPRNLTFWEEQWIARRGMVPVSAPPGTPEPPR